MIGILLPMEDVSYVKDTEKFSELLRLGKTTERKGDVKKISAVLTVLYGERAAYRHRILHFPPVLLSDQLPVLLRVEQVVHFRRVADFDSDHPSSLVRLFVDQFGSFLQGRIHFDDLAAHGCVKV